MAASFNDFLASRGLIPRAPVMPPAAAQAAADPRKLQAAIQIARSLQSQQSAPPAPATSNFPIPTPPSQNPYLSNNMAQAQAVIAAQNAPVQTGPGMPYVPNKITTVDQGGDIGDTASSIGGAIANTASDAKTGAGNIIGAVANTAPAVSNVATNAASSAATDVGNYAADRYQKWLDATNQINADPQIKIDPNTGQAIKATKMNDFLAPAEAAVTTLLPDIGSAAGAAADKTIKPAASAIGSAVGGVKGATWDQMSPTTQKTVAQASGIDHIPTQEELAMGAGKFFMMFTYPQQHVGAPALGYLFYQMAVNDQSPFDSDTRAQIIAAYQKGGGKGVWEDWVAKAAGDTKNAGFFGLLWYGMVHAGLDIASDPLTWTPFLGEALKGMAEASAAKTALDGGAEASKWAIAANVAGHVVNAPNEVADAAVNTVGTAFKFIKDMGGKIPGAAKVADAVTGSSTRESDQAAKDIMDALNARRAAEGGGADSGALPVDPTAPPTAPSIVAPKVIPGTPIAKSADGKFTVYKRTLDDGSEFFDVRKADGTLVTGGYGSIDQATNSPYFRGNGVKMDAAAESGALPTEPTAVPVEAPIAGDLPIAPPDVPISPDIAPESGALPTTPTEPPTAPAAPESDVTAPTSFEINPDDAPHPIAGETQEAYLQRYDQWVKEQEAAGGTMPDWSPPDAASTAPIDTAAASTEPPTWQMDNQITKAKDAVESGNFSPDALRDPKLDTPEFNKTIEAKMQNILLNPDYNATAADRQYLYAKGDILKPNQVNEATFTRKVVNGDVAPVVRDAKGYPVYAPFKTGGLQVNDAALAQLPEEVQNAIRAGKNTVFTKGEKIGGEWVPGQFQYRVIDKEMLDAMSPELRQQVADILNVERAKAVQRWNDIQDVHASGHGTSPVARDVRPSALAPSADTSVRDAARAHVISINSPARYKGPYEPIIRKAAKDAQSADDIVAALDQWATDKYGPREANVHASNKLNRAGKLSEADKEIYNATTGGRGWKATDIQKEAVPRQWEMGSAQATGSRGSMGLLPPGSDKVQALIDRAKPRLPQPLDELKPRPTFSAPLEADIAIGKISPEEAVILDQQIRVKGSRADAYGVPKTEPIYQRYDSYIMQGMSERDALLQTTYDAVKDLHIAKNEKYALQKALKIYDRINLIAKNNIQYNWMNAAKGPIGDWAGDGWTMIVTGHGAALRTGWGDVQVFAKAVMDMDPTVMNQARSLSFLRETGIEIPTNITVDHAWKVIFDKGEISAAKDAAKHELSLVETTRDLAGKNAANVAKVPAFVLQNKWAKIGRNIFDMQRRISVFVHEFTNIVTREGETRFELSLIDAAKKAGADPAVWKAEIQKSALERMTANGEGELATGFFNAADVLNATGSTDLSRKWQSFLKDASKRANAEQNRVLFSYAQTNADKLLSRAMFFHYWASRALALHAETALRNPALLAFYVRTYNGLQHLAETEGYPPGMRGMVDYFQSATGFTHYFNPVGIVTPFMMMNQAANGGIPWWQRAGLFLAPAAEAGMAMMGATSNIPDLTGTATIRGAAIAFANALKADGYTIPGTGPDGQLTEDYIANLQSSIYQQGNKLFQAMHLTDKDYAPFDPQTAEVAQIKAVITTNMVAQYGPQEGWSDAVKKEYVDAQVAASAGQMTGNIQAHKAFKAVTMAQVVNKGLNAFIPGGSILKFDPLEQARVLNKTIPYGADASTLTPEQIAAQNMMQGVNASGQGGTDANHADVNDIGLTSQQDAYANLGTPAQQTISKVYNAIRYSTAGDYAMGDQSINISGKDYSLSDITTMSAADRTALADQYVSNTPGGAQLLKDIQDQQAAYKTAHPQIVDFKAYQKEVYADAGGPRGWRIKYAKANPNFAAAMEAQRKLVASDGSTDFLVQKALDQWAAGRGGYEARYGIPSSIYDVNQKPLTNVNTVAAGTGTPAATTTSGGGTSTKAAAATPTQDLLTQDIAAYQTKTQVLKDAMAAHGMTGNLEDYTASKYNKAYIQQVFGDLIPTESSLMKKYDAWVQGQPAGADTSPTAFGVFYDKTAKAATADQPKIAGWSAQKTKLYYAWKAQQGTGRDSSTSAFDRYLVTLSSKAINPYAPSP